MRPGRAFLALAALVAVIVGVNVAMTRLGVVAWDLTAEHSSTLSPETRRVLHQVDRRIRVTAFFARDTVGRVEAATLLSRYRKANHHISFRILDPSLAPGEAQRFGISEIGSAAVQDVDHPEDVEIAQFTIEIDVTSAIARLVRNVHALICFTAGHGERSPETAGPDGLSQAASLLRSNGYRWRTIDLLATPRVPRECDAVVIVSPTAALGDEAVGLIRDYLRRSGKALVLADPGADVDLSVITRPWGIRFIRGIVIEGDSNSHLPDDVTAPIVRRYSGASQVVRGLGPTFFPVAMGVSTSDAGDPGLTVSEIAATSRLGYLDRRDLASFDPKIDRAGPVAIGASADDSAVVRPGTSNARIRRTRILAFGDSDFATDAYIGEASNGRLLIQGVDWLTQPEELVTAVPNFPKVRELRLTEARSRYLLLLTAGVIPGLFVIAGGFVWVIRRGR